MRRVFTMAWWVCVVLVVGACRPLATATPTPAPTPTPSAAAAASGCPAPAEWTLTNTTGVEAVMMYRLSPPCAYDAIFLATATDMLYHTGLSAPEIYAITGLWSSSVVTYDEILAGRYPPYDEWPAFVPVEAPDGRARPKPVAYNRGFIAGHLPLRSWSPITVSVAPHACYQPDEGLTPPLRDERVAVVCTTAVLRQAADGQPFIKQYNEHLGVDMYAETESMYYEHWFITEQGRAFAVARELPETAPTHAQWVRMLQEDGETHGTGVWVFQVVNDGAPPPPTFANSVDGFARLETLTGQTLTFPDVPDGWEEATQSVDDVWEVVLAPVWEALGAQ